MPTAAEKNAAQKRRSSKEATPAKKSKRRTVSLVDLPEPELRAKLLATPTLPDRAWAPAIGKPERDKGESRTAYIERVLASE